MGTEKAMRHIRANLGILAALLCMPLANANPIGVSYISELFFDSGKWIIELNTYHMVDTLEGWTLSSRTGTSSLKPGIRGGGQMFVLITADSLVTPIAINPGGDSITIDLPGAGPDEQRLVFGNGPDCDVRAPLPGWSISYGHAFYLDRSPTIGTYNDSCWSARRPHIQHGGAALSDISE